MAQSRSSCITTREEATSKWSDVIKNSKQIATEPQQIYLLNTVKKALNKDETVRRYTFGRKDPNKRNRTIMMVGETGTGKSTLINMMVNYMLGVKWEDKIRFEIIPDEGKKRQTVSQTSGITVYEIYGLEELSVPFSLTVIDTPGYGDTGGLEKDKIAENLYSLLKSLSSVEQIDAACLVVKASQNRLSPRQKYIFDAILCIFGKNMEQNLLTLITFSNWTTPSDALEAVIESGVPFQKDENNDPVYFLFDNCSFKKFDKRNETAYKTSWNNGAESFREFFQTLNQMQPQNFKMTENVLRERKKLEACIQSWESQIRVQEMKLKALEDVQKILEEHEDGMRENNNFQYKYRTVFMKKVQIDDTATCCPECEVNCHYPGCWWVSDLKFCSIMEDGKCTSCPGKCSYKVHQKGYTIYQPQYEERTGTYEDLKKDFDGRIESSNGKISKLKQDLKDIEDEKTKLREQFYQCILQLKGCALKSISDSTRKSIASLIAMMQKNKDTEKVEQLQMILEKNE